jgi:fucose permease
MAKKTDKSEIFYGWFVVIACFFVTMSLGETMWSFGVFFKPLESEFHWSRTLVSSGYTAFLITYSLSSIVAGKISGNTVPV